jgi:hypothetical protein
MIFRKRTTWIVWIALALLIKVFSFFPGAVEKYYSAEIYMYIARFLRMIFGWIPFSVGDIFYAVTGIYLLYKLFSFLKKVFKKQLDKKYFFSLGKNIFSVVLIIYVVFNLIWGLNYNRNGIAYQLQLNVQPYSTTDLSDIVKIIVERLNTLDSAARLQRNDLKRKNILFLNSIIAYKNLENNNPIFGYPSPSVKPSIFSYAGNYLGFTGYYNPFSGEAQVNTTVPVFVQPFTTCHEIGHQLGYAKENEANFAGYLSAKSSDNKAFQYSVYFDLYLYAARELYVRDSTLLVPLRESLRPAIRKDFRDLRAFYKKYENPFGPIISKIYGNYLKANQQPQGLMSYNEVIAWLIAYEKKYGKEAV